MNKIAITILAILMAVGMTAPAAAYGVTAWATGSATSRSGPNAESSAGVILNGALSYMSANVDSSADGDETAASASGAGGILDLWDYAEVFGWTAASVDGGSYAEANANSGGYVPRSGSLADTYVDVGSTADGDEVYATAEAGTIAAWWYNSPLEVTGIVSAGSAYAEADDSEATADGEAYANAYPWFEFAYAEVSTGGSDESPDSAWVEAVAIGTEYAP